ncbi:MAG: IPExxxVDY family protein [Crocinitomicaceae bacterium]
MAKYKLDLEEDYTFQLIGVCSNHSDYRLCWAINRELGIQLNKTADFSVMEKKQSEHLHSFYEFYDEEEHIEYYLIKNVSNNYHRLVPEKDQIDYFLILKNNYVKDVDEILLKLKNIESILTAFIFDPATLKSKGNLIF